MAGITDPEDLRNLRYGKRDKQLQDVDWKKFEALLGRSSEDTAKELLLPQFQLKTYLKQSLLNGDHISMIIEVLATACDCADRSTLLKILTIIVASKMFLKLPQCLLASFNSCQSSSDDFVSDLRRVLSLCTKMLECLPHNAAEQLGVVLLHCKELVSKDQASGKEVDPEVQDMVNELINLRTAVLESCVLNTHTKKMEEMAFSRNPPDHFWNMSIVLTSHDIHSRTFPFLRPMVINGKFQDVEHYLDTVFRLMREDFVGPLRDGIHYYLQKLASGRLQEIKPVDLKVYYNVQVVAIECKELDGIVHLIQFDVRPFHRVKWDKTKRLRPGTLICLSSDNFETFFLATIAHTELRDLRNGLLFAKFLSDCPVFPEIEREFTIIESPSYFPAYHPVLECVSILYEGNLPFTRYLTNANSASEPPAYLMKTNDNSVMVKGFEIRSVLDFKTWPTAEDLTLDDSQYAALQYALTSEIAIIQGPPGTGKTFLGIKIVETLLRNKHLWCSIKMFYANEWVRRRTKCMGKYVAEFQSNCWTELRSRVIGSTPILVICFTNHALDQFLEGILGISDKESIVRVGGQSKNEALWPVSIKQKRMAIRCHCKNQEEDCVIKGHLDLMKMLQQRIECYQPFNEAVLRSVILNPLVLQNVMRYEHYLQMISALSSFQRYRQKHISVIEVWLGFDTAELNVRQNWGQRKEAFLLRLFQCDAMTQTEASLVTDLWALSMDDRWRLFRFWIERLKAGFDDDFRALKDTYENSCYVWKSLLDMRDLMILSEAKIIGMTTSGAAKHRDLLEIIRPGIVIIEEAAEVLESHVLTSLTTSCQHLIMIGDHQQLRPNPTVYRLGKDFNLDISMFERFILNGVKCETLVLQHRMRPRIASLLVPHIYPHLKNHPSVEEYEHIRGVDRDVFFIDHQNEETTAFESESKSNEFEAKFALGLCKYFINQGYKPKQITVLTTYVGQLLLFKNLLEGMNDDNVRQAVFKVVDNYQGEENDIIILSLVRSNTVGSVGFLKIENRVCVALSRAREGLFCIGNFQLLVDHSKIWKPIVANLKSDDSIGHELILRCQNHPETVIKASTAEDFKNAPEGGCKLPCDYILKCGHPCSLLCHGYDREHIAYECPKPCTKYFTCGHKCPDICGKICDYKKCEVRVEEVLDCGHSISRCCTQSRPVCRVSVMKVLPCGHEVSLECFRRLEDIVCNVLVNKTLSCGHDVSIACHVDPRSTRCEVDVDRVLSCGHTMSTKCAIRMETPICETKVGRVLPCGHSVPTRCGINLKTLVCKIEIEKVLSCGHTVNASCGRKDVTCNVLVSLTATCGHLVKVPCSSKEDKSAIAFCTKSCINEMHCGHVCKAHCGDCHPHIMHEPCQENCQKRLICGHFCAKICGKACSPCFKKCETKCFHRKCPNICSSPCPPCEKPCVWKCQHFSCTNLCSEVCNRPPCQHPCSLRLPCGHQCVMWKR